MFHMSGQVGDLYRGWSETLASALARIEALIDFGEVLLDAAADFHIYSRSFLVFIG